MPDPLQRLVLSRTLWLMVAPPLVGFLWHLAGHLRGVRVAGKVRTAWTRRVGVGSILLASAATLTHVVRLARAPAGARALLEHIGSNARTGPVVVGFDLMLDPLSGATCALACAVALAGAVLLASRTAEQRSWKAWAWLELALVASLISFLSGGFVTMLLGWLLATGAGAWLAGWSDPTRGAVRATRGALGMAALLLGASLLLRALDSASHVEVSAFETDIGATGKGAGSPTPVAITSIGPSSGGPTLSFQELAASFTDPSIDERGGAGEDGLGLALAAFAVAALAMSASTPPAGAPLGLAAVASGATSSALGPFLLLRLNFLLPLVSRGSAVIAAVGVILVAMAAHRALNAPTGPLRWIALVCGAPAGLTCISLGTDGPSGALLVLVCSGLVAALLAITAVRRGFSSSHWPAGRASFDDALFRDGPERAGALLMTFEHWVVDAIAGAAGVLLFASAWALDHFDGLVLAVPADGLATRVVRLGRRVEPILGGSLVRIFWMIVGLVALAVLGHALWVTGQR